MKKIILFTSFVDDPRSCYLVDTPEAIHQNAGGYDDDNHREDFGVFKDIYGIDADAWIVIGESLEQCTGYMLLRWLFTYAQFFDPEENPEGFEKAVAPEFANAEQLVKTSEQVNADQWKKITGIC